MIMNESILSSYGFEKTKGDGRGTKGGLVVNRHLKTINVQLQIVFSLFIWDNHDGRTDQSLNLIY